MAVNTHYIHL